jgi:hypothetical protein
VYSASLLGDADYASTITLHVDLDTLQDEEAGGVPAALRSQSMLNRLTGQALQHHRVLFAAVVFG